MFPTSSRRGGGHLDDRRHAESGLLSDGSRSRFDEALYAKAEKENRRRSWGFRSRLTPCPPDRSSRPGGCWSRPAWASRLITARRTRWTRRRGVCRSCGWGLPSPARHREWTWATCPTRTWRKQFSSVVRQLVITDTHNQKPRRNPGDRDVAHGVLAGGSIALARLSRPTERIDGTPCELLRRLPTASVGLAPAIVDTAAAQQAFHRSLRSTVLSRSVAFAEPRALPTSDAVFLQPAHDDQDDPMSRSILCALAASLSLWATAALAQTAGPIRASRDVELPHNGASGAAAVVTAAVLSPDGRLIATAGDDHLVRLWSLADGRLLQTCRATHGLGARAGLPSRRQDLGIRRTRPAGAGLGRRHRPEHPQGRGRAGRRVLPAIQSGRRPAGSVAVSTRQFIFSTAPPAPSSRRLPLLGRTCGAWRFLPWSPAGGAGRNGKLQIWDLQAGAKPANSRRTHQRVRTLAFSPTESGWRRGRRPRTLPVGRGDRGGTGPHCQPDGKIRALVFCDGARLAVGSTDNLIRVWNIDSRQEEMSLTAHRGRLLPWTTMKRPSSCSGSYDTTVRCGRSAVSGQHCVAAKEEIIQDFSNQGPTRP